MQHRVFWDLSWVPRVKPGAIPVTQQLVRLQPGFPALLQSGLGRVVPARARKVLVLAHRSAMHQISSGPVW